MRKFASFLPELKQLMKGSFSGKSIELTRKYTQTKGSICKIHLKRNQLDTDVVYYDSEIINERKYFQNSFQVKAILTISSIKSVQLKIISHFIINSILISIHFV